MQSATVKTTITAEIYRDKKKKYIERRERYRERDRARETEREEEKTLILL